MKKFNTILAIAAVALTSVLGFTSCDKNDDIIYQNQPTTECFGNNGGNTQGNPGDNNPGTAQVDTGKSGKSTTTNIPGDVKAVVVTAQDLAGTYKYTEANGKEWFIEMTESTGNGPDMYYAKVTVPEGYGVDAKTYEGEYKLGTGMVTFRSNETSESKNGAAIVGFAFQKNQNLNNIKVQFRLTGSNTGTYVVFVKQ